MKKVDSGVSRNLLRNDFFSQYFIPHIICLIIFKKTTSTKLSQLQQYVMIKPNVFARIGLTHQRKTYKREIILPTKAHA